MVVQKTAIFFGPLYKNSNKIHPRTPYILGFWKKKTKTVRYPQTALRDLVRREFQSLCDLVKMMVGSGVFFSAPTASLGFPCWFKDGVSPKGALNSKWWKWFHTTLNCCIISVSVKKIAGSQFLNIAYFRRNVALYQLYHEVPKSLKNGESAMKSMDRGTILGRIWEGMKTQYWHEWLHHCNVFSMELWPLPKTLYFISFIFISTKPNPV